MAVTLINLLEKLISTAKASYADIDSGALKTSITKLRGGAGFTKAEAIDFVREYSFLSQQRDTDTGFLAKSSHIDIPMSRILFPFLSFFLLPIQQRRAGV